jgi:hypothetical protein
MNNRPKDEWRANRRQVESACQCLARKPRRRVADFGFCSFIYAQAARSARVLLARYQCIRQASMPSFSTASIDCLFQSASVKVAVPGSLFSKILTCQFNALGPTHEA